MIKVDKPDLMDITDIKKQDQVTKMVLQICHTFCQQNFCKKMYFNNFFSFLIGINNFFLIELCFEIIFCQRVITV